MKERNSTFRNSTILFKLLTLSLIIFLFFWKMTPQSTGQCCQLRNWATNFDREKNSVIPKKVYVNVMASKLA